MVSNNTTGKMLNIRPNQQCEEDVLAKGCDKEPSGRTFQKANHLRAAPAQLYSRDSPQGKSQKTTRRTHRLMKPGSYCLVLTLNIISALITIATASLQCRDVIMKTGPEHPEPQSGRKFKTRTRNNRGQHRRTRGTDGPSWPSRNHDWNQSIISVVT